MRIMTKQTLSIEQMQHLQELGLELKETKLYWVVYEVGHENNFVTTKENAMEVIDESCGMLPAYTLQDVLDALPVTILHDKRIYELDINMCNESIEYVKTSVNDVLVGLRFTQIPLIDAAYSMLWWAIKNKFVETNKNE